MEISLNSVSKEYRIIEKGDSLFKRKKRSIQALNDVSFSIKSGEICGLIGLNGAGKSTLTKILCGVLSETSGEIKLTLEGKEVIGEEFKKNMSVIFGHRGQLWDNLQVADSYEIISRIYDIPRGEFQKRLRWLGQMLELNDLLYRPARQLSLGQRMKCEVAGNLLCMPKLLLLDEPTIGLDILTKEKIFDTILAIHKEIENTIIFTSHDLKDVGNLCNRILILNKGKLIFDDSISTLYETYANEYIITLKSPNKLLSIDELWRILDDYQKNIKNIEYKDNSLLIHVNKEDNSIPFKIMELLDKELAPNNFDLSTTNFEQIIRNIYEG
ncbi:ATP-binding cassette domain-containing protein [Clostridium algidicarnis]|uniref:ATP-binding cassette domain-containing protein n=1 Tax=Clostridium algidicarnis TaxID=37659 RepID=UPI0016295F3D|nr:ATP-binding cassette domain-containing protein [Clostridium algidicarnis]MBB6697970.1 ATP-binding cassette domain-containing protein [Clostridium algidicarnis]MBU3194115.1 ATP-binding cassette domain-containing protein [Clostridium algidicarnis]